MKEMQLFAEDSLLYLLTRKEEEKKKFEENSATKWIFLFNIKLIL